MKKTSPLRVSKMFLLAGILTMSVQGFAQNPSLKVFEEWRDTVGTQNTFYKSATITIPGTANVLVCGATLNSAGNYDLLIQKLNGAGNVLWSDQLDGNGNGDDIAIDVQVDGSGNVFIVGNTFENSADSFNAITVMYNSSGAQQWVSTYNGTGSQVDGLTCLCLDGAGGVYVGGLAWNGSDYDFLAIMYDYSGSQQWVTEYDFTHYNDGATRIFLSYNPWIAAPALFLAGGAQTNPANYDYAILNLDETNGSYVGSNSYGTTPLGIDRLADIAVDDSGNIYLTGSISNSPTWSDIRTMKIDTGLNVVWYDDVDGGFNLEDFGTGIALDSHRNVVVVGTSKTSAQGMNYTVLKYNNAGVLQWTDDFNGSANGHDSATAVVISPNDTDGIYVTGFSYNGSTNDYWTIRYDGVGNRMWEIGMNSILNGDDKPSAIALDTLGNVIVTGPTKLADTVFAYTTVKYVQKNMLLPDDTITAASSSFVFTENNGQLLDTDSSLRPEIRYYTIKGSPQVYFMDTAVSYVFSKLDTSTTNNDSLVRVDQKFVGANPDLRVYATDVRDEYSNFYLGHIPEGRAHVESYNQLVSFNVWNNVDIIYGSNAKGLKTYYVCKPGGGGGSATQIDLKYSGADSIRIGGSGELLIYTRLGVIVEPKASAWQIDAGGNFQALGWQPSYNIVATNEIKFTSFGAYNPALPLIIAVDWGNYWPSPLIVDNLLWSTFEGGSASDEFLCVSASTSNWIFAGGLTYSTNYPSASGGYQGANGGNQDGVIRQYQAGLPSWSTYYGGGSSDGIASISANGGTNSVYFTGGTQSADFPVGGPAGTFAAYSTIMNGPSDAIIVKLDGAGARVWSTCYGSATGNEVGNVIKATYQFFSFYVAGSGADASTPLTTETGASNLTLGDAFILKFNPTTFAREWATLYGGTPTTTHHTAITDMELGANSTNHIVITGYGIGITDLPAANNSPAGGFCDAFIASFNSSDVLNWSTYYGGSTNLDKGEGVVVNGLGEIFITGSTQSSDLPVPNPNSGYCDATYAGGTLRGDAFVAQFDANGTLIWGTYLGGIYDEEGFDIAVDYQNNIYVTGYSRSAAGFSMPPNPSGVWDQAMWGYFGTYILEFDRWQGRVWGTYFGGESYDWGYSLHIYKDQSSTTSYLYAVGRTTSDANAGTVHKFPMAATGAFSAGYQQTAGLNLNNWVTTTITDGWIAAFDLAPAIVSTETIENPAVEFSIFPNPNAGSFGIEVPTEENEEFTIVVYDVLGQKVYSETVVSSSGVYRKQIVLEQAASGMYSVQLQFADHVSTQQTIIQR